MAARDRPITKLAELVDHLRQMVRRNIAAIGEAQYISNRIAMFVRLVIRMVITPRVCLLTKCIACFPKRRFDTPQFTPSLSASEPRPMSAAFFFGYGSLVNRATHSFNNAQPAQLTGWRRVWRHTDLRPVAFLSVQRDEQSTNKPPSTG